MVVKFLFLSFFLTAFLSASSQGVDVFKLFGGGSSSAPRPSGRGTGRVSVLEKGYVAEPAPRQRPERRATPVNERVVTNTVERVVEKPVERIVEKPVEVTVVKTVTNTVERVVEKPVERIVEKPVEVTVVKTVTNTVERVVEKPVERIVEKPVEVTVVKTVTNTVERIVEKPVERIVEKPVEVTVVKPVTSVVEKVVYDRSAEKKMRDELDREEKRGDLLEAKNTDLAERNEELAAKLKEERARRERLERVVPKASRKPTGRPARITSATTYYDRKEGVAFFDGNVHVDDEQYQLHAKRAYVFMDGSNDVRRIVAIGNVAMTNEARRAYAAKASYYKNGGMVVLYSGDGIVAEVRDESKEQDQVIRGKKIKFWVDTEQVEVIEAVISAPTGGMGKEGLKGGFNKMMGK